MNKVKCEGCGDVGHAKPCVIPGRGHTLNLCVYGGGPKRHQLKMECYAKLFETKCILCGEEHDRALDYAKGFGLYPIHSFSPVCDKCIMHAKLGKDAVQCKQTTFLGSEALLKEGDLTELLAGVIGHAGKEYGQPSQLGSGNSAYVLQLTSEQRLALTLLLSEIREYVDREVKRGRQEGRSLLLGLAQGKYTTKDFDEQVNRQEK